MTLFPSLITLVGPSCKEFRRSKTVTKVYLRYNHANCRFISVAVFVSCLFVSTNSNLSTMFIRLTEFCPMSIYHMRCQIRSTGTQRRYLYMRITPRLFRYVQKNGKLIDKKTILRRFVQRWSWIRTSLASITKALGRPTWGKLFLPSINRRTRSNSYLRPIRAWIRRESRWAKIYRKSTLFRSGQRVRDHYWLSLRWTAIAHIVGFMSELRYSKLRDFSKPNVDLVDFRSYLFYFWELRCPIPSPANVEELPDCVLDLLSMSMNSEYKFTTLSAAYRKINATFSNIQHVSAFRQGQTHDEENQ